MAQRDEEHKLFEQHRICIVCTDSLPLEHAEQVCRRSPSYGQRWISALLRSPSSCRLTPCFGFEPTIEEYGGEPSIHQSTPTKEDTAAATHIISNTINFETFDLACEALIPVVRPSWLHESLKRRKLSNPRHFSPDPRLFMNDVVVCCGDIPEGDKEAIVAGVLARGGLYSQRVSGTVTHLVDLTDTSDKARLAQAKKLKLKIVLPHWFDDCLKLGQRIDEAPYLLPDPEILSAGPDDPLRRRENKGLNAASTPDPSHMPDMNKKPTPHSSKGEEQRSVFNGKTIMLSPDLRIGERLLESIQSVLESGGATVTGNVYNADWVICRFRDGFVYRTASRLEKEVGNLAWLYSLMIFNEYTRPLSKLLHYPVSRTPIPGFEGLKISLSNYVGEARIYLENLISAAGAECTKTLKQENTHLITAHGTSEKCTAAREWGLQVVNHLWLEDSYIKWRHQPESDPCYSHFPPRTNLGEIAGHKMLDMQVLERVFFASEDTESQSPEPAMQEKDQNATSMPPPELKQMDDENAPAPPQDTPQATKKARRVSENKKIETPIRSRLLPDGKENDTPSSTSSRKSKEAATARLHEYAPDFALYEKERKRRGGVIFGGRRKSDEDRVTINPKKRRSLDPQEESENEEISMHLLITGYQKWVGKGNEKKEDADKRHLRDLGIMVVQDARRCTHMAAPSILRTTKFVNALAYAPAIISTDFITECLKQDKLLDPKKFGLVDKSAESKFNFSLAKALKNAKKNNNQLLKNFRIYCVEDIRGGFEAFKSIVETNGGQCLLYRGRLGLTNSSRREESDDEDSEMEDDEPGRHEWDRIQTCPSLDQVPPGGGEIKKTPRILRVDWLLDMAMSQELKPAEGYELTEEMVDKE
ncbi:hypothetical protein N7470_000112 [Penicillium chermesinum]|nr:hypothetical protein N7470_000112 [Penicillium chermesinum]